MVLANMSELFLEVWLAFALLAFGPLSILYQGRLPWQREAAKFLHLHQHAPLEEIYIHINLGQPEKEIGLVRLKFLGFYHTTITRADFTSYVYLLFVRRHAFNRNCHRMKVLPLSPESLVPNAAFLTQQCAQRN